MTRLKSSLALLLAVLPIVPALRQVCLAQEASAPEASAPDGPEAGQSPPLPPVLPDAIPAFPGAWGGGMFTVGGRGGRVLIVDSLEDRGPGTLRAAIEAEGPRTVVFRVAGTIFLQSALDIESPFLTVAGQSAPGDGICIAHDSININTHQVILRHLRVRRGLPEGGQGSDNIGGNPEGQVIVDHCSTSWGMDENLSLYRHMREEGGRSVKYPTRNVTVQFSISSEALDAKNHAFGGTWGGEDSTFHHNLFACNTGRNPSIGMGGEFDFRNNVIFNWRHRTLDGGDETSLINVINNYYKAGPATNANMRAVIARIEERDMYSPGRRHEEGGWYASQPKRPGKWYVAGNVFEGEPEVTRENWKGMRGPERLARVHTAFEAWPVRQESAEAAYESVLESAGATLPLRDAVDRRVIDAVRSGKVTTPTGIVRSPEDVGGFPEYSFDPEAVPPDADRDGAPDDWERRYGLDPGDAADARSDLDADGYTNLEEYLNGTDPTRFVDYKDLGNNADSISG